MRTKLCQRCNGSGLEPDHSETGKLMRAKREDASLSLRDVAERIGISAAYLSDMELGRRAWASDMIAKFEKAISAKQPRKAKQP